MNLSFRKYHLSFVSQKFQFEFALLGLLLICLFGCTESQKKEPHFKLEDGQREEITYWSQVQRPGYGRLNSIHVVNDGSNVWAVGEIGQLLHFDGNQWHEHPDRYSSLKAVWMTPQGDSGWAVGKGVILHFDDNQWVEYKDPKKVTNNFLTALWMTPKGDQGWAVGNDIILHFTNNQWVEYVNTDVAKGKSLNAVWMTPEGDSGWAVGNDIILHFDDDQWVEYENTDVAKDTFLTALWMTPKGDQGWAVGKGVILHFTNNQWVEYENTDVAKDRFLNAVWMTAKGDRGWAVGRGGLILYYDGNQWIEQKPINTFRSFNAVWISPQGDRGWAICDEIIFHFDGNQWLEYKDPKKVTNNFLKALWMTPKGDHGWAVGKGVILHFDGKRWQEYSDTYVGEFDLNAIWMSSQKKRDWAVGQDVILYFEDKKWKLDTGAKAAIGKSLRAVWMTPRGDRGWAVGLGVILEYDGKIWREHEITKVAKNKSLNAVCMTPKGDRGWAVGNDVILRFDDNQWVEYEDTIVTKDRSLHAVWISPQGDHAWAVGNGVILYFDGNQWSEYKEIKIPTFKFLTSLWMSPQGDSGWAVGDGLILHFDGNKWQQCMDSENRIQKFLNSFWISPQGDYGWAVGSFGYIASLKHKRFRDVIFTPKSDYRKNMFSGSFDLSIPEFDKRNDEPLIELHVKNSPIPSFRLEKNTHYNLTRNKTLPNLLTIELTENLKDLAFLNKGKKAWLQFKIKYINGAYYENRIYRTNKAYIEGRPKWHFAVLGLGILLSLNVVLVLLAIPARFVRTIILHPTGANLLGLILGKYLIIDAMIRFVGPIKIAMFRDYRNQLGKSPGIEKWNNQIYIPPSVYLPEGIDKKATNSDKLWKVVFETLLRQPKNKLWITLGPSGIGKTALLENWAALALHLKQTPILIRLGSGLQAEEDAAAAMSQYGDVNIKPDVAQDLIMGGGFVILLDGFNEDRSPDKTREFVKQAVKRNLVIMTSQFPPPWKDIVKIQNIDLAFFGREQLAKLLDKKWIEQIFAVNYLEHVVKLPHTAQMLSEYINRNQSLPKLRIDIYADSYQHLSEAADNLGLKSQVLNLEDIAWKLFQNNEKVFDATDAIPERLCNVGVDKKILTKISGSSAIRYQFVHERIHRYFVARFLDRQDPKSFEDWHSKIKSGLGRYYWIDALDLWSEIYAHRACNDASLVETYETFLLSVADFNVKIFKERLYPQADRLDEANFFKLSENFIRESARYLSQPDK